MSDVPKELSDLSVQFFAIASMGAIGLRYTLGEILRPLHRVSAVVMALAANFVAVPLLAFVILQVIDLDRAYAIGLALVAAAAGAPMIITLTRLSGGDVAFSAGLLVLLIVVSIAYMPLVVPRLAPDAEVRAWAIAAPLVRTMLLPLAAGLLVKRLGFSTGAILSLLRVVTNASLVTLVVLTGALNLPVVVGVVGTGARVPAVHRGRLHHRMDPRRCIRRPPPR